jgi:hypothetical protein
MLTTFALSYKLRSVFLSVERVNFGWFDLLYLSYMASKWPFIILIVIDLIQMTLTIWGSAFYFGSTTEVFFNCMFELPNMVNFQLVILLMGYLYMIRMIITICHFTFGTQLYRWIRRTCPCFRRFD